MDSAVAITQELDDLELAVKELATQIRDKISLKKNSVGIAYCDADVDTATFGALMHEELGIDIIGLTATAIIERYNGYNDMVITLTVLTSDDVEFSTGSTGDLEHDKIEDAVRKAYRDARAKTKDEPKLILTFAPLVPEFNAAVYMEILDKISGGIPVFGGVAADNYDFQQQKNFFNGQACARGLVFVLFTGNIKPVFAMEHHFGAKVEKKGTITKATNNMIHEVDGQSFKEFVASMVPVPEDELVVYHFLGTPFVMELPDYEKDEQPVVRCLASIEHSTGSGGFFAQMPEGSVIFMNIFQRDNLNESCKGAMSNLMGQMLENKGYEYNMIFVNTCNARYLLMGDTKNLESDILTEALSQYPDNLNAVGFYGAGEMCPTGKKADGTAKNRYHNISFAICAI